MTLNTIFNEIDLAGQLVARYKSIDRNGNHKNVFKKE